MAGDLTTALVIFVPYRAFAFRAFGVAVAAVAGT
jgi:hypothetical protein